MATASEIRLGRFREGCPRQGRTIGGVAWSWFDSGGERPALMLLDGGLGDGEAYFPLFEPLAGRARVLALGAPPGVSRLSAAVEGLASVLDGLRIDRVHLFGHSQGGYLAQSLLRARPERVASLALSATCPPSARHARRIEGQIRLLRFVPDRLLRLAAAARIRRIAAADLARLPPDESRFWRDFLTAGLRGRDLRARFESTARLQLDYHRGRVFAREDLAAWPGRILVLTYGRDRLVDAKDAESLMAAYPSADHVDFPESGHLGLIVQAPEIARRLAGMIDERR